MFDCYHMDSPRVLVPLADGFEEIDAKMVTKEEFRAGFGMLEERLDRVEQRLGKVENSEEEVHDILVSEEKEVLDLQKRVGVLERAVK